LLREVFRLHQNDFKRVADMVLIARNSIAEKTYADVERDFLRAVKQAKLA
jgi:ribonuclease P protein component